jgi:hypothetical protein
LTVLGRPDNSFSKSWWGPRHFSMVVMEYVDGDKLAGAKRTVNEGTSGAIWDLRSEVWQLLPYDISNSWSASYPYLYYHVQRDAKWDQRCKMRSSSTTTRFQVIIFGDLNACMCNKE